MHQSDRVIIFIFLISLFFFGYQELKAETISSISDSASTITVSENSPSENHLPSIFMVIPFVVLLVMIATGPLFYHHFWEKYYPIIAILLGLVTVFYYLLFLQDTPSLLHTAAEYLSFIALLSSLFVASGGILIRVDKKATPWLNAGILLFGSLIANIIGTTGASMLLIRPFIKINQDRIKPYHIIFFIFLVSNIGGCLTPIGDPPLFLGFLRGVRFFLVITEVWYIWLPTILLVILVFVIVDSRNTSGSDSNTQYTGKIEFKGMKNVFYLIVIVISVFIDPAVMSWVPSLTPIPFGIREIIMFSMVVIAYKTADENILKANEFTFEPIREVAYLFVGIFATMIPALQLISYEANVLGEKLTPGIFYWATGVLSAFLDNAPTYLNFLSASMGKFGMDVNLPSEVLKFERLYPIYISAISVAAVFFGAMTYIGNGPNFMVKSISERAGIKMPSFFGYLFKYSIPILIPIFTIVWLVFYLNKG